MKGEKWKDIPGLEGYFMVSNLGRVKRMEYKTTYKNGAKYIKPERIIKPFVVRSKNEFKKDMVEFLTTRVQLEGIRYNFTLARLVYYCFVRKFDLQDQHTVILCKDLDNFNINPRNLTMSNLQGRSRRVVERERFNSPFKSLPLETKKKRIQAIIKTNSRQVTQYNLNGKKIMTYNSMASAQKATGIFASSIGHAAAGHGISAGGFLWKWGSEKKVNIEELRAERKKAHRLKYGQKVTQYDFNGNRLAKYYSLQEAEATTGARADAIRLVLKGKYRSAKGWYWRRGFGPLKIDLSGYKWGHESMAAAQSIKVCRLSLNGKVLQIYNSIREAAERVGVSEAVIIGACRGRQKTGKGFKWKYA